MILRQHCSCIASNTCSNCHTWCNPMEKDESFWPPPVQKRRLSWNWFGKASKKERWYNLGHSKFRRKSKCLPALESGTHSICPAWNGWSIVAAHMATVAKVFAAAAGVVLGFGFGSVLPSLFGFGGAAFEWPHAHLAPCTQPDGIWWKIHGVLAFSSALNGFPGHGAAPALASVGAAEAALAGTAGVFVFGTFAGFYGFFQDCSINTPCIGILAFFHHEFLQSRPLEIKVTEWWIIRWTFDLMNHPQAVRPSSTYQTKIFQAFVHSAIDHGKCFGEPSWPERKKFCKSEVEKPCNSRWKMDWEVINDPRIRSKSKWREITEAPHAHVERSHATLNLTAPCIAGQEFFSTR